MINVARYQCYYEMLLSPARTTIPGIRRDDMRISALLWLGVNLGISAAIQEAEPGQFPYIVSLQVR